MQSIIEKFLQSEIPIGFATKLGTLVAAISAVLAAITPLLAGDQTPTTIALIAAAFGAIWKVLDGRFKQAAVKGATDNVSTSSDGPVLPPTLDVVDDPNVELVLPAESDETKDLHDAPGA